MSQHLWKVTAVKNAGKLTKGMTLEIIMKGTTAKPNAKQIVTAIEEKYGETVSTCHCGLGNFEFEKLS